MRKMREAISARVKAISPRDYLIIGGVVVSVFAIHFSVRHFGKQSGRADGATAAREEAEEVTDVSRAPAGDEISRAEEAPPVVPRRRVVPLASADSSGQCLRIEYPGDGPTLTRLNSSEWGAVSKLFHSSKGKLSGWLRANKTSVGAQAAAVMEAQLRQLKLARPPVTEEPDLAWRGGGVLARAASGPVIRLGGGFAYLVRHNPERAAFEMTRLVAQAWAPCELSRVDGGMPWVALQACLGVSDADACAAGSYSEAGWAVSTALAFLLSRPDCKLAAFEDSSGAACLASLQGGGRAIASEGKAH